MRSNLSSTGLIAAVLCCATAQGGIRLPPPRSAPWRLRESIRRETFAAIDRGRDFLAAAQMDTGLWPTENGAVTCWPAMAFTGENGESRNAAVARRAAMSAAAAAENALTRILTPPEVVELARTVCLLRAEGLREDLVIRAVRRLRSTRLDPLSSVEAALLLEARGFESASRARFAWNAVLAKTMEESPVCARTVSLAAFARLSREEDPRSGAALQAHLRWLVRHWPPTAGESGWFVRLLESVSPASLHDAGFPLDWRQRVADALIARQRRDPETGSGFWSGAAASAGSAEAVLRETTAAVMVLRFIAE